MSNINIGQTISILPGSAGSFCGKDNDFPPLLQVYIDQPPFIYDKYNLPAYGGVIQIIGDCIFTSGTYSCIESTTSTTTSTSTSTSTSTTTEEETTSTTTKESTTTTTSTSTSTTTEEPTTTTTSTTTEEETTSTTTSPACVEDLFTYSINLQISGGVRYLSTAQTPMPNVTIKLFRDDLTLYTSVVTNQQGYYDLGSDIPPGNYYVQLFTEESSGGINIGDTARISSHISGSNPLTYLEKLAADVNADNIIDSNDLSLLDQRIALTISTFPAGDWVFGTNLNINFKGWYMINYNDPPNTSGTVYSHQEPIVV